MTQCVRGGVDFGDKSQSEVLDCRWIASSFARRMVLNDEKDDG